MSIRTLSLNLLLCLAVEGPALALADDTPEDTAKAQIRDRFRLGMEKYQEGAYREAIGYWDAIYRELGPSEGYRLSFNLARAYEKFSDFTRAAERYESFLTEVELRRQDGKAVDGIIDKEEKDAGERLAELRATKGRINVIAGPVPVEAQIDETERRAAGFSAYVAPGTHTVVFVRGKATLDRRSVSVKAGEIQEIAPPAVPEPERIATRREVSHPFTPVVLYIAGGVTLASILAPALAYAHASSIKSDHDAHLDANGRVPADQLGTVIALEDDYTVARTTAYATLAIPLALAAITGGLTTWYFLGTQEREIVVRPMATASGAGAMMGGRF